MFKFWAKLAIIYVWLIIIGIFISWVNFSKSFWILSISLFHFSCLYSYFLIFLWRLLYLIYLYVFRLINIYTFLDRYFFFIFFFIFLLYSLLDVCLIFIDHLLFNLNIHNFFWLYFFNKNLFFFQEILFTF